MPLPNESQQQRRQAVWPGSLPQCDPCGPWEIEPMECVCHEGMILPLGDGRFCCRGASRAIPGILAALEMLG